jgi:hypothetical protein
MDLAVKQQARSEFDPALNIARGQDGLTPADWAARTGGGHGRMAYM